MAMPPMPSRVNKRTVPASAGHQNVHDVRVNTRTHASQNTVSAESSSTGGGHLRVLGSRSADIRRGSNGITPLTPGVAMRIGKVIMGLRIRVLRLIAPGHEGREFIVEGRLRDAERPGDPAELLLALPLQGPPRLATPDRE